MLAQFSRRLSYEMVAGPSPATVYPRAGPYNERHGYSRIPFFQSHLVNREFQVVEQARVSSALDRVVRWGIAPPYREVAIPGFEIHSAKGDLLYSSKRNQSYFLDFSEVPPLLARTLLFIENQQLDNPSGNRSNPVIEWERLAKATFLYAASKMGLSHSIQGGSTLATQIEKFRYSPQGRTHSAFDKARQLISASLKAYRDGTDTRPRRQEIVVDYLNSMPLSAAPGYGEVNGIGEGLYAWFGLQPEQVWKDLTAPNLNNRKITAYKHVIALLVSLPAPTIFLLRDHQALERRVDAYTRLLQKAGVIDNKFAEALRAEPVRFAAGVKESPPPSFSEEKATNALRASLLKLLGVPDLYSLDRLHLQVESTIDRSLQSTVTRLFQSMTDPEFVQARGLNQEKLLQDADSRKVIYSLLLFERTPEGNLLRVQADNLNGPFDLNSGMRLELGSTAKLRTLAHYLEVVALLHRELSALDDASLAARASSARDPITRWAAEILTKQKHLSLNELLEQALERRYSGSPYEVFFTGSGVHRFENFEREDNFRIFSVERAFQNSVNLVFVRLMRDLVRFHEARLPYDAAALVSDLDHPLRRRFIEEAAEEESRIILSRAYRAYRGLSAKAKIERLLGNRTQSARHHAILFFAWNKGGDQDALAAWLEKYHPVPAQEVPRLYRAYSNPRLNLADFGYLLSLHPLKIWCAGELAQKPDMTWQELWSRSAGARQVSYAWLFRARNRRAQDLRLRIRIERDAFARMTPYWQRLGFPFEHLVPSYATALGSSSDRPSALADLMGIILNGGERRPTLSMTQLRFASGTPYETVFQPKFDAGERVMAPEVARALQGALERVVDGGTASRLKGAFVHSGGTLARVGGKTGSGDNRFKTFNRYGQETSSRALSRTAAFVFYIDDRYYGVLTTLVSGRSAGSFSFTSALPVTVVKMLAPAINARLQQNTRKQDPPARMRVRWSRFSPFAEKNFESGDRFQATQPVVVHRMTLTGSSSAASGKENFAADGNATYQCVGWFGRGPPSGRFVPARILSRSGSAHVIGNCHAVQQSV
ncbi:MAG TPA: transglycosylase domain-containing protein [Terriglobales bacterium]|nr:transglycosylase domain-containing protein [Terriglobales bacterium]